MKTYTLRARLIAYFLLFLAAAASCLLLLYVYIIKSAFITPSYSDSAYKNVISASPRVYSGGKMLVETDLYSFNALAYNYSRSQPVLSMIPENVLVEGLYCEFKEMTGSDNTLYVNVRGPAGIVFPFMCGFDYSFEGENAEIIINGITLGKHGLPLGRFFWTLLKLPERYGFGRPGLDGLMYMSGLAVDSDGSVTLEYNYDEAELTAALNGILSESDERKIEFHEGKRDVESSLISMARNKAVTPAEAKQLVTGFEKNPETFLSLCYLLNDGGIRLLCEAFGESYYKYMSSDRLAEASNDAINSDLNAFNKHFSRLLLQYLYRNPDYEIINGTIYVRGNALTPETVLSGSESENVYDIEIMADDGGITVKYRISGYEMEKKVIPGE